MQQIVIALSFLIGFFATALILFLIIIFVATFMIIRYQEYKETKEENDNS